MQATPPPPTTLPAGKWGVITASYHLTMYYSTHITALLQVLCDKLCNYVSIKNRTMVIIGLANTELIITHSSKLPHVGTHLEG